MSLFCVKRGERYVHVAHQGQVKPNETLAVLSSPGSPLVNKASKEQLLSKNIYFFLIGIQIVGSGASGLR